MAPAAVVILFLLAQSEVVANKIGVAKGIIASGWIKGMGYCEDRMIRGDDLSRGKLS